MVKLYAERDLEMLDMTNNYYSRHVMAMTEEGLDSKSSIAAELAYRDWIIDEQQKELQKYKDRYPDYVECANCGSVTHAEGVKHDGKESAWTVWPGGENPVPWRLVDVKFRDGTIVYKYDSCIYRWWLCGGERDSDIIAYRVVG